MGKKVERTKVHVMMPVAVKNRIDTFRKKNRNYTTRSALVVAAVCEKLDIEEGVDKLVNPKK